MVNILSLLKNEEILVREKLRSDPKRILEIIKKQYKIKKSEIKKDPALKVLDKRRSDILKEQEELAKKNQIVKLQEKVREELSLIQKLEIFEKRESKEKVEKDSEKSELKEISSKKGPVRPALIITMILIIIYFAISFTQDLQAKTKVPAGYAYIQISSNCFVVSKIENDEKIAKSETKLYKKFLEEIARQTKRSLNDVCIEADSNKDGLVDYPEISVMINKYPYIKR